MEKIGNKGAQRESGFLLGRRASDVSADVTAATRSRSLECLQRQWADRYETRMQIRDRVN